MKTPARPKAGAAGAEIENKTNTDRSSSTPRPARQISPDAGSDRSSRRPQPAPRPAGCPLSDARFHRLIDHLCSLGPRPVGECLLQLIGTNDDARTALVVLLERYRQLDADVVQAVGGDRFPPAIFAVAGDAA